MSYIVSGIDPAQFSHLFGLSDQKLAAVGVVRKHIAEGVAIPERSELRDAPVGSDVLLVDFNYQPAANPYHGRHAIFVREGSTERAVVRDQVPEMLSTRLLSLRAFDHADMLVSAEVVPGNEVEPLIASCLGRPTWPTCTLTSPPLVASRRLSRAADVERCSRRKQTSA